MSYANSLPTETSTDTGSPFASRGLAQWGGIILTGEHDPIGNYDYGSETFQSTLSDSDRERGTELVTAMVSQLGILETDLRFVPEVVSRDRTNIVLIDGSPNGLHVGNYKSIMGKKSADKDWLTLNVGDRIIDTLESTTYGAYWSMISEARNRRVLLPDSVALSHTTDAPWTATMLTGEDLTDEGYIYVASVSSNAVSTVDHKPTRGGTSIRVRCSAVVGPMVRDLAVAIAR